MSSRQHRDGSAGDADYNTIGGSWDERFGHLRRQEKFEGSLRLIVGTPA